MTRDEYMRKFRERLRKEGGWREALIGGRKGVRGLTEGGQGLLGRAVGALGEHPALVTMGLLAGKEIYNRVQAPRQARALMASQDLALSQVLQMFPEISQSDPQVVHSIWQTILQFAPHVATNPRVAGTFLRSILQFPGHPITPAQIRELQQLEHGLVGAPQVPRLQAPLTLGQALTDPSQMKLKDLRRN